ncbi:MAG: ABC transporter substrate-binding protein [Candidatus Binatia bacterium]
MRVGAWTVFLVLLLAAGGSARPAEALRVVSLAPSVTETIFAVGAGESLVGVTDFCDWPPPARAIARVGSYIRPNVEAIVARGPDLVIAVPSPGNRDEVEAVERLGVRVLIVSEGPALDDVYGSIGTIADAVGRREAGEDLVARMRASVAGLRSRLGGAERKTVLFVVDRSPLVVAGDGTLIDDLVRLAGGRNAARGLGPWPRLSLEYVVRLSPEIILDGAMRPDEERDVGFYEGLGLRAVREGKVHATRIDEIMRPGPRVTEGLERLARQIHPEAFR